MKYADGETKRNPLGNLRRENTRIGMPDTLNTVSTYLRINTLVSKKYPRIVAVFNTALTGTYHHTLYESHKYLLCLASVLGSILRPSRFYKTRRRDGPSSSLCFCSARQQQTKENCLFQPILFLYGTISHCHNIPFAIHVTASWFLQTFFGMLSVFCE